MYIVDAKLKSGTRLVVQLSSGMDQCTCSVCGKKCGNAGGVAKHMTAHHPVQLEELEALRNVTGTPAKKVRVYATLEQKARLIERYLELEGNGCLHPKKTAVTEFFGSANYQKRKSYLNKWLKDADRFRSDVLVGRAKTMRKMGGVRGADHPDAEDELYIRFLIRRNEYGYATNHYWLRSEFKKILQTELAYSAQSTETKAGYGWAVRWCIRYRVTTQTKNNDKVIDQVDRAKAIRVFHRYLLMALQHSEPQTCPKYGRFDAMHMLHWDQVPLPFACGHRTTLNPIGAPSCRIAGVNTAGLEKRQATAHVTICANGYSQWATPWLILKGPSVKGPRGKVPWVTETVLYEKLKRKYGIRVAFQKNAWADAEFIRKATFALAEDASRAGVEGEIMLGMDNYKAQIGVEARALYGLLGFVELFTPANCTDCVSPVDHHVGRFIQAHMAELYRKEVEANPHIWIASSAGQDLEDVECHSAMARRILLAKWFAKAWRELTSKHQELLVKAFIRTGFLLAKDGSEDDLMQIQGWNSSTPYSYRN